MNIIRLIVGVWMTCAAGAALAQPERMPLPSDFPTAPKDPIAPISQATPAATSKPTPAAPATPAAVASPDRTAAAAATQNPSPTLQPLTLIATLKAAERYAVLVSAGGWPTDIGEIRPNAIGPDVAKLRKRLAIEGDLAADAPTEGPAAQIWDKTLAEAVKHFQARVGLRPTGVVAGATVVQLNVPAETRARALAASAERLSAFNFGFGDRYVVVNLPSTEVEAVENDVVVHRYNAIVGDPDHPSPQIAAHIQNVNLNPTWTVPVSIIKREIIPRMQRDPGYLTREKIRILNGSGQEVDPKSIDWTTQKAVNYTLRQDAGSGNSLGSIRIDMPNKHAVYMHDTPGKRLFGADYRFLSHGCVRVQGVYDYAEWLLAGTANAVDLPWDKPELLAGVKEGAPVAIKLVKAVPVIWTYLTGWANDDGPAHFRSDVYGLDNPQPVAAAPPAPPAQASGAVATAARPPTP